MLKFDLNYSFDYFDLSLNSKRNYSRSYSHRVFICLDSIVSCEVDFCVVLEYNCFEH